MPKNDRGVIYHGKCNFAHQFQWIWCDSVGSLLIVILATPSWAGESPYRVDVTDELVKVAKAEQPLLTYQRSPNPRKPYLKQIWTPGGFQVLRDSPEDHHHHHGLMFALRIDDVDFWIEDVTRLNPVAGNPISSIGRQVPQQAGSFTKVIEDPTQQAVNLGSRLDWLGGEKRKLVLENREITLHDVAESFKCTLLT